MKRNLLASIFVIFALSISGQQLPNSGFENWTSGNPNGWGSADEMFAATGLVTGTTLETQVSPGNSGTSACQLKTQTVNLFLIGNFDIPGIINSGPLSLDLASGALNFGRIPYSGMPSAYSFYYKYSPVNGDTAATVCYFTKWNTATNSRDTVGSGAAASNNAVANFTMITIPITWVGTTAPDSVQMFFISSAGNTPQINSTLVIDDIDMILPTGEKEPFILNEYSVYPNPTTELVNFSTKNKTAKSVEIFDYSGKLIEQSELINGMTTFISSKYSEGVYLYRIIDNNGKVLKTDKITVMK